MTGVGFTSALFVGTALIAGWFVVRFPRAAPRSLTFRSVAPLVGAAAMRQIRVDGSDRYHMYFTVFGIALPVLVAAWITAFWLLDALRNVAAR